MSSARLLTQLVIPGHVERLPNGGCIACIHLPGPYKVRIQVDADLSDDAALEAGHDAVQRHLETLLKAAPARARRAYCLALGGGFDQ